MSKRLQDRVAVITGAASGIGKGCANVLAAEGATIAICDINPHITTVGRSLNTEHDVPVEAVIADVRSSTEVARFVENTIKQFSKIDILINNAGIWRATPITDSYEKVLDDFEAIVATNLKGVFQVGRSVIPHMMEAGSGEIINIATDHIVPPHGFATGGGSRMDVYDASKWGTRGLTESWAKALKPHNIRVNAIAPGMVGTDRFVKIFEKSFKDKISDIRMGRLATPKEIADTCVYLGSDLSTYVTGQVLAVDGSSSF